MPDKDIQNMHRDADFKATGADKAKNLQDGFANHGLTYAPDGHGALHRASHSIGIRPHPHGHAIAKGLLGTDRIETVALDETRPLIDLLQEATFGDSVPMQWVADKYALRGLLRKAHCFRLDSETSAMVADFSIARWARANLALRPSIRRKRCRRVRTRWRRASLFCRWNTRF